MKQNKDKKSLSSSAKKFIEDQKFIFDYLAGNKTIDELNERGIKPCIPIKTGCLGCHYYQLNHYDEREGCSHCNWYNKKIENCDLTKIPDWCKNQKLI